MEHKRVPLWAQKKEGFLDKLLKVTQKVAVTCLSVSLAFLAWTLWRSFGSGPDVVSLLVASGLVAAVLIVWIPKLQLLAIPFKSPAERFGAENDARKTVATLIGGIAIFVSFYTAQQQLGVQQQVQFTDRYTKAIEQLASSDGGGTPKLAIRVGGLYALEQIMNTSEAQHLSILEVLCAYVRESSLDQKLKPNDGLRADTRVALTIIGRRERDLELTSERKRGWRLFKAAIIDREFLNAFTIEHVRPHLDLSGSNLANADLSHLVLAGADLSDSRLSGCRVLFTDIRQARFARADLSGCVIASSLEDADLSGANLEGALISGKVKGATLRDANIGLSIWTGADLDQPRELQSAKNWQLAFYSDHDLKALGLPTTHNVMLLRRIRASFPSASTVAKLRLAMVFQLLQTLTDTAQNLRDELVKPLISGGQKMN